MQKKLDSVKNEIKELMQIDYKNEDYVQKLRQAILQEAISGKLTSQDLNDEPASELLKKIRVRKENLVAEKKIRTQKHLPAITEEEIPFKLPSGWSWTRWQDITKWITYGFTKPMPHEKRGVPIITAKNVFDNKVVIDNADFTSEEAYSTLNAKDVPQEGDITES